jgi:hypothetical protein
MRSDPSESRAPRAASLVADRRGLAAVEYVLLVCLVVIVGFQVWTRLGGTLRAAIAGVDREVGGEVAVGHPIGDEVDGSPSPEAEPSAPPSAGDPAERSRSTGERVARGIADGLGDVVGGAIDGAIAVGRALASAVIDPLPVAEAVVDALSRPGDTARAAIDGAIATGRGIVESARDGLDAFAAGDAYTRARMLTNAGAAVVPVGSVGTMARAAGAVTRASRTGERLAIAAASPGDQGLRVLAVADERRARVWAPPSHSRDRDLDRDRGYDDPDSPRRRFEEATFGTAYVEQMKRQRAAFREAVAEAERRARADGWRPTRESRVTDLWDGDYVGTRSGQRYPDPDFQIPPGFDSVAIHGSPEAFSRERRISRHAVESEVLPPERLARELAEQHDHRGQPLVMISCSAGAPCPSGGPNAAQRLADATDTHVVAATSTVVLDPVAPVIIRRGTEHQLRDAWSGRTADGEWRVFSPRSRASSAAADEAAALRPRAASPGADTATAHPEP